MLPVAGLPVEPRSAKRLARECVCGLQPQHAHERSLEQPLAVVRDLRLVLPQPQRKCTNAQQTTRNVRCNEPHSTQHAPRRVQSEQRHTSGGERP